MNNYKFLMKISKQKSNVLSLENISKITKLDRWYLLIKIQGLVDDELLYRTTNNGYVDDIEIGDEIYAISNKGYEYIRNYKLENKRYWISLGISLAALAISTLSIFINLL